MTTTEWQRMEDQQVERRYREIAAEACEMARAGLFADDGEANAWIAEQQDRVMRAPWG